MNAVDLTLFSFQKVAVSRLYLADTVLGRCSTQIQPTENGSFIIGLVNVHCKMLFTFVVWRRLSLLLVGGQIVSIKVF